MAGRRLQHLERRSGVYYLRLPIPTDLASVIGRCELRWSLRTRDAVVAGRLAILGTLAFRDFCGRLREMTTPKHDAIKASVADFYAGLVKRADPLPSFGGKAQADTRDYARDMARDLIVGLKAAIDDNVYDTVPGDPTGAAAGEIKIAAQKVAAKLDLDLEKMTDPEGLVLLQA